MLEKILTAETRAKIILLQGGSRSSKTWSTFQFFLIKALQGEELSLTIVRDKLSWIKQTLLKDFLEITDLYGIKVDPPINSNRQEQVYSVNGTEFAFFGLDYSEKLHGRKQDWFWINEGMETIKKAFDQLEMRTTKGGIIDYNPVMDEHWIFDLQKRPDTELILSTMFDNPYLPEAIIEKIRSYEPTPENIKNGTGDQYMWDVYGLGKKAKLKGAIFPEFHEVSIIPAEAKFKGIGLDFGYNNDPSAAVELFIYNNEIYLNEILYETKLTNFSTDPNKETIDKRFRDLQITNRTPIFPDSAEPKSADELAERGWNIQEVKKGADSVNFGINLIKSYKINVTSKSLNLINEFRKYKWMEKRDGSESDHPVDAFNHAIDAARYVAMETLASEEKRVILSWA